MGAPDYSSYQYSNEAAVPMEAWQIRDVFVQTLRGTMKPVATLQRWVLPSAGLLLGVTALTVGLMNTAAIAPVEAQEMLSRVLTVTSGRRYLTLSVQG